MEELEVVEEVSGGGIVEITEVVVAGGVHVTSTEVVAEVAVNRRGG